MPAKKMNISADRAEGVKRTNVRAGKTKTTTTERQRQNKGVADGTIRLGKNGKSYNVYDAKSGTWKRGVVSTGSGSSSPSGKSTTPSNLTGMSVNKPGTMVPVNSSTTNLRGRSAKNPTGPRVSATGMKKPTNRGWAGRSKNK